MLLRKIPIEKRRNYSLGLIMLGVFCITIANVFKIFLERGISDFIIGMLTGMSVVFNLFGIYLF